MDELGPYAFAYSSADFSSASSSGRFTDLRRVLVRGGLGGRGCVSKRREPFVRGPKLPNGADGGAGGAVGFVADDTLASLAPLMPTLIGLKVRI